MPDKEHRTWSEEELDTALAILRGEVASDERPLAAARTALMTAAQSTSDAPRRRERWTWLAASAAAVIALTAGLLTVQPANELGATAAAKTLNSAADKLIDSNNRLEQGQYRYVKTHAWWMASATLYDKTFAYLAENVLEIWAPARETDEWLWRRDVTGKREWILGNEAEAAAAGVFQEPGWPEGEWRAPCGDFYAEEANTQPCVEDGTWQTPDEAFMASLPRDADKLYKRLRTDTSGHGPDVNMEILVYVADMLRSGLVPADLRAALYRVLARVPTLEIIDKIANLDGRTGVAFGIEHAGQRQDIIIDPQTGEFIGERQVMTEASSDGPSGGYLPAGTVTTHTSVTTSVVDEIGAQPTN